MSDRIVSGSVLGRIVGLVLLGSMLVACSGSPAAQTQGPAGVVLEPRGEIAAGLGVIRVVDGDTIHVNRAGQDITVRMIGIDTPETVKPDAPVGCFGPEASDFAKDSLTGRAVTLEFDDSQGRTDRFGRTLAYVWVEGSGGSLSLFNLEAVARGYAEEQQLRIDSVRVEAGVPGGGGGRSVGWRWAVGSLPRGILMFPKHAQHGSFT